MRKIIGANALRAVSRAHLSAPGFGALCLVQGTTPLESRRLLVLDPLLEALDGIVIFFVALAAIGIWRAVARREQLRGATLDRLRDRLEKRGPKMAARAKTRLERRIKRLSA